MSGRLEVILKAHWFVFLENSVLRWAPSVIDCNRFFSSSLHIEHSLQMKKYFSYKEKSNYSFPMKLF